MVGAKAEPLALIMVFFIVSGSLNLYENSQELALESFDMMYSDNTEGKANFSSSGNSGVAISGEPAHIGDLLGASLLVSNSGNSTGMASLNLEDTQTGEIFSGTFVEIGPGSTREVSASFSPSLNGSNYYSWWVSMPEGEGPESLSGQFSVHVSAKQSLLLTIDTYQWDSESGLEVEASVYLSQGLSRILGVGISVATQGNPTLLQMITIEADPGRRSLDLYLGHPVADSIIIELIPDGWSTASNSVNVSQISVEMPIVEISSLEITSQITPPEPTPGDPVVVTVSITNNGVHRADRGKIRVISITDRQVLAESSSQFVSSGATVSNDIVIPSWPDGDRVDLEVQWLSGQNTKIEYLLVDSKPENSGLTTPFDLLSATYGAIGGVLAILLGTLVWRGVANRTPSISKIKLRETKEEKETRSKLDKRELSCAFCDQRLMVPLGHKGAVKCPSCTMEFQVGVGEEEVVKTLENGGEIINDQDYHVSRSNEDTLNCPECDQALKVPIERRPVLSRCPVCKTEFMAET